MVGAPSVAQTSPPLLAVGVLSMPPRRRPSFVRLLFLVAAAAAATISSSFPLNRPSQRIRARPPPPPPPPSDFSPCRPPRAVVLPAVAVASRSSAAPRGTAGPSASNPFVTTAGTRFALGCAGACGGAAAQGLGAFANVPYPTQNSLPIHIQHRIPGVGVQRVYPARSGVAAAVRLLRRQRA